jgi:formylglycine-generating enzyme required for sulfatase activity
MEWFDGESLDVWLKTHGSLTPEQAQALFPPVVEAMREVHAADLLHRDLSPDNLLLRPLSEGGWDLRIIDFGLAYRLDGGGDARRGLSAVQQSLTGKLDYAPPEQCLGGDLGPWSDVYSFGKTVCKALFDDTEPRSRELAQIPAGLAELLEDCISKPVDRRPADFGVVAKRLQALQAVPAKPIEPGPGATGAPSKPSAAVVEKPASKPRSEPKKETRPRQETAQEPIGGSSKAKAPKATIEPVRKKGHPVMITVLVLAMVVGVWWGLSDNGHSGGTQGTVASASMGKVFQDPLKDGGKGPEMVVIPAGSFSMGAPKGEPQSDSDEHPQHRVTFSKPFAIGRYELSFADYDKFCDATGRKKPDDRGWGRGRRPVIYISWYDATAYAEWLSKQTGKHYRLPSEAEWEYAARAGTTTPFWWGKSITTDQANYDGNYTYDGGAKGVYRQKTLPVDSFEPNPWGLYQVHGNVLEWVQDCWNGSYASAPDDGSAWEKGDCGRRLLRGGSCLSYPWRLRSADRGSRDARDNWRSIAGVRLAQDLSL